MVLHLITFISAGFRGKKAYHYDLENCNQTSNDFI